MEIIMDRADIRIGKRADGAKALVIEDTLSKIRIIVPLDEAGAKTIASALMGGLTIVDKMPTTQ